MAAFNNHIDQAKSNLNFLLQANQSGPSFWDWQVTICFYTAVHTVNAHLAQVGNLHYQTHEAVKQALNPFNLLSICKVPQDVYLDYGKLEGLSRRSRYLCNEATYKQPELHHMTFDKHFAKAIKCLDRIMLYFSNIYGISFGIYTIKCVELNKTPLSFFKVSS